MYTFIHNLTGETLFYLTSLSSACYFTSMCYSLSFLNFQSLPFTCYLIHRQAFLNALPPAYFGSKGCLTSDGEHENEYGGKQSKEKKGMRFLIFFVLIFYVILRIDLFIITIIFVGYFICYFYFIVLYFLFFLLLFVFAVLF